MRQRSLPISFIADQEGVWLFEPVTEAALSFVRKKVTFDEWLLRGQSFVVDYRGAGALAEDLEDEGCPVGKANDALPEINGGAFLLIDSLLRELAHG